MKVSLVVLSAGKASGQAIAIALPQFVIGRDPQCNLRPASPLISKKHCAVKIRQGNVYIEDYGSTNGTFLNDQPVKGEIMMKAGDVLKAGPLMFRLAIEGQPAANPTPTNKTLPAAAATTATKPASVNVPPAKSAAAAPPKPASNPAMSPAASTEDDLAAMMLGSDDDSETTSFDDSQVPGGTTIMEMSVPPEVIAAAAGIAETKPETPAKNPTPPPESKLSASRTPPPEAKKPEPKKVDAGSAQSAAKALLEKMYRRGRS
ncbi:MAG: FHA domain-containing protein [Gemmataceae bacterium]|nr:FHA domain-containing protein [Gemmataceae bacterium]